MSLRRLVKQVVQVNHYKLIIHIKRVNHNQQVKYKSIVNKRELLKALHSSESN